MLGDWATGLKTLFHSSEDFNPILRIGPSEGPGMEADDKAPALGSGPLVPTHPPPLTQWVSAAHLTLRLDLLELLLVPRTKALLCI